MQRSFHNTDNNGKCKEVSHAHKQLVS